MPRLLDDPVPRLEPVLVDIEVPELVRLPRTDSGLPAVRPEPIGSVRTGPVLAADPAAGAAATATGTWAGAGVAAGAIPHTLQNPSSISPVHPGLTHAVMTVAPSRRWPADTG
jgi:hypothetical protein